MPPKSAQQSTSHSHSHCPSVASTHHWGSQRLLPQSTALEGTTLDCPNQNAAHHSLHPPSHANSQHSIHPPSTPSQQAPLQPLPTSRQGSVQPHLPPSRQGSVHLPPSRQGSVQPQLHPSHQGSVRPSTQSCQGSVNPPPHAYNAMDQYKPQDDVLIYEQGRDNEEELRPQVSRKRPYANIIQLSGDEGDEGPEENQRPRLKRRLRQRAKQVPQTPIRPPQGVFAGPSTGTHSRTQRARPTIVMTNATPVPGARGNGHDAALDEDMEIREGTLLQPRTLTNTRPR